MGHLERDHRNAGGRDFIGDNGRDFLLGLKFNDKIHSLPDKLVRIFKGDLGVILVVENQQVNSSGCTRCLQAGGYCSENGISEDCPAKPKRIFLGRETSR